MDPDDQPRAAAAPRRPPSGRSGGGQASRSDYLGCGLWALGFLVLVVVSFSVGVALRPDDDPETVTLTSGGSGDSAYVLRAHRDEVDDPCVTLHVGGEEVTGQCGSTVDASPDTEDEAGRYVITSSELPDGTTIAFAPVPREAEVVRLTLADGSRPTVEVRTSETTGIAWFAYEADSPVAGPAEVLDGDGDPVRPPG